MVASKITQEHLMSLHRDIPRTQPHLNEMRKYALLARVGGTGKSHSKKWVSHNKGGNEELERNPRCHSLTPAVVPHDTNNDRPGRSARVPFFHMTSLGVSPEMERRVAAGLPFGFHLTQ